jgi:uncharacterized membrane protein
MTKIFSASIVVLLSLAPLGCGKVYNSSTYDANTYGNATGSSNFLAAKTVINENCATCHTHPTHQAWAGMSEQQFIQQGLVVAGNLAGSQLYTKIQGNRTTVPGNMPDGGAPLTPDQITTIETWILNITP